eukprot:GHVT01024554.1.p1 GENE.GHVT01024554.1~~GHVT01024554.1.p1  ORF type:complete len:1179 (+),score=41.47 GHVT01024554.1:2057-5593(+)
MAPSDVLSMPYKTLPPSVTSFPEIFDLLGSVHTSALVHRHVRILRRLCDSYDPDQIRANTISTAEPSSGAHRPEWKRLTGRIVSGERQTSEKRDGATVRDLAMGQNQARGIPLRDLPHLVRLLEEFLIPRCLECQTHPYDAIVLKICSIAARNPFVILKGDECSAFGDALHKFVTILCNWGYSAGHSTPAEQDVELSVDKAESPDEKPQHFVTPVLCGLTKRINTSSHPTTQVATSSTDGSFLTLVETRTLSKETVAFMLDSISRRLSHRLQAHSHEPALVQKEMRGNPSKVTNGIEHWRFGDDDFLAAEFRAIFVNMAVLRFLVETVISAVPTSLAVKQSCYATLRRGTSHVCVVDAIFDYSRHEKQNQILALLTALFDMVIDWHCPCLPISRDDSDPQKFKPLLSRCSAPFVGSAINSVDCFQQSALWADSAAIISNILHTHAELATAVLVDNDENNLSRPFALLVSLCRAPESQGGTSNTWLEGAMAVDRPSLPFRCLCPSRLVRINFRNDLLMLFVIATGRGKGRKQLCQLGMVDLFFEESLSLVNRIIGAPEHEALHKATLATEYSGIPTQRVQSGNQKKDHLCSNAAKEKTPVEHQGERLRRPLIESLQSDVEALELVWTIMSHCVSDPEGRESISSNGRRFVDDIIRVSFGILQGPPIFPGEAGRHLSLWRASADTLMSIGFHAPSLLEPRIPSLTTGVCALTEMLCARSVVDADSPPGLRLLQVLVICARQSRTALLLMSKDKPFVFALCQLLILHHSKPSRLGRIISVSGNPLPASMSILPTIFTLLCLFTREESSVSSAFRRSGAIIWLAQTFHDAWKPCHHENSREPSERNDLLMFQMSRCSKTSTNAVLPKMEHRDKYPSFITIGSLGADVQGSLNFPTSRDCLATNQGSECECDSTEIYNAPLARVWLCAILVVRTCIVTCAKNAAIFMRHRGIHSLLDLLQRPSSSHQCLNFQVIRCLHEFAARSILAIRFMKLWRGISHKTYDVTDLFLQRFAEEDEHRFGMRLRNISGSMSDGACLEVTPPTIIPAEHFQQVAGNASKPGHSESDGTQDETALMICQRRHVELGYDTRPLLYELLAMVAPRGSITSFSPQAVALRHVEHYPALQDLISLLRCKTKLIDSSVRPVPLDVLRLSAAIARAHVSAICHLSPTTKSEAAQQRAENF